MTRLRDQIGPEAVHMIQTVPGFGYKFDSKD